MNPSTFIGMIAIPLVSSPFIYLSGRLGTHEMILKRRSYLVRGLAILAILVSWIPYVRSIQAFLAGEAQEFMVEAIWLRVDGVSLLVSGVVLLLGTMAIIFSGPYMSGEVGEEKYYAMLMALIGVMVGLCCAADLFNLWVWFEAMAVSSYLLVAFYREQAASLEAGMKYLIQSAVGSVLVLIGISLVLANAGTLDMAGIRETVLRSDVNRWIWLASGALFVVGFGVKVAFVPLHTWLPDAHSQAPSGISAMLSGAVIEVGLIAMLRALSVLTGFAPSWGFLLLVFGTLNILYGNLLALRQTAVKRMLAYSSLSHVGYIMMGFGVTLVSGLSLGAQGAFFHLFTHMLMKGLAFLAVGALMYALFLQNHSHAPLMIKDLAGSAQKYPLPALTLCIAVLGLGGLPPLAGFMSKWQIFLAGFETHNVWIVVLMVFMALNSVLSLAYYAPLVNLMYRQSPSEAVQMGKSIPFAIQFPLMFMAFMVILFGFVPHWMNWITQPAAQCLLAAFGN